MNLENVKNWKTTLLGVLTFVISMLVLFGVINADQQTELNGLTRTIIDLLIPLIAAISGVINIFLAKDK